MVKIIFGILFFIGVATLIVLKRKEKTPLAKAYDRLSEVIETKEVLGVREVVAEHMKEVNEIEQRVTEKEKSVQ